MLKASIFKFLILVIAVFLSSAVFSLGSLENGSSEKTYYEILGVSPTANLNEIKTAYRTQAMKHHPDRAITPNSKTAGEKMAEINEAYNVLKSYKLRRQYDAFLSQSSNLLNSENPYEINFYFAFEQAVSPYSKGFSKAMWFQIINEMRDELNDRQVHSIIKVIIDIENEHELVRRAALTALENYFNQLYIEDIELLLILNSAHNKRDDRDLKISLFEKIKSFIENRISGKHSSAVSLTVQKQKSETLEKEIGIKKRAKRITDKWFAHKFQHSHTMDQILAVVAGIEAQYKETSTSDFFRKGALTALQNHVQRLNANQIQQLKDFSSDPRWSRHLKRRANGIIRQWEIMGAKKGTAVRRGIAGEKSLIRSVKEQELYSKDPELYNIKSLGDAQELLKSHPSPERAQQIVEYTLPFIPSFERGQQFIKFIQTSKINLPNSSKDQIIDKTISYLTRLSEVQSLMLTAGSLISKDHFSQMLNQVMPFIKTQRGLKGGTRFLSFVEKHISADQKSRIIGALKHLPAQNAEEVQNFIKKAEGYLSEEDQNRIRSHIKRLEQPCQKKF